MHLTSDRQYLEGPSPAVNKRAARQCALARELESAGNYEAACTALEEFWPGVGERPRVETLDPERGAEVLLRAGALTGWSGGVRQVANYQEFAKDLISESASVFSALGQEAKAAEAQIELGWCYWREGAFDEARITLKDAVGRLGDSSSSELKIFALVRLAEVERAANRFNDALQILQQAAPLVEAGAGHALKGNFHNTLAIVLRNLGTSENRSDYTDRALIEYAAASFHFEQAGHLRYRARVENNLGFLYFNIGRFEEAHAHLDDARRLFASLRETGSVAQVDDTRARALLAQGRNSEAERVVRASVNALEKGGQLALLAEALTTHGTALARLGRTEPSRAALERAASVAEQVGDLHGAGRALLALIEESETHLTRPELASLYERADQLLSGSQHPETLARLRDCARRVIAADAAPRASQSVSFVCASEQTRELVRYARNVAATDRPILVTGETGTGKEILARLMHEWSGRSGKFVAVNCAALCETVVESQLFGHRKGSFTDAVSDHEGAVRTAVGGTLFLDEIGDLSPANQGKLLRLIECGEVYTVGSALPEHVDVRIIAATNRDLKQDVARGRFRDDLYYRLGAFLVEIPPLRERPEDIPELARHFIEQAAEQHRKTITFAPESLQAMRRLPLQGNARELRSTIERAFLLSPDGSEITPRQVETLVSRQTQRAGLENVWAGCSLEEEVRLYEGKLIRLALEASQGQVTRAARLLGTTHQALSFILNGRQKELLSARTPPKKRRTSLFRSK